MKEETKDWIENLKQLERLHQIQKKMVIKLDDYFAYSGKTEEYKKEEEWEKNKLKSKKMKANDSIVQFYFDNPGYTLKEIARVFEIQESVVSNTLDKYFNNKKSKYGKNIEYESNKQD